MSKMAKYIICGEIFLNDNRDVVAIVSRPITINVLISQQNENIWHEKYE